MRYGKHVILQAAEDPATVMQCDDKSARKPIKNVRPDVRGQNVQFRLAANIPTASPLAFDDQPSNFSY